MNKTHIAVVLTAVALVLTACADQTPNASTPVASKAVDTAKKQLPPQPIVTHSDSPTTKPTAAVGAKPTTKAAPPISAEQRNATKAAMDYLSGQSFSRKGLIEQLKYEGYPTSAATKAVDSLHIDWNEQAALVARDYLDSQSFSRKSLGEQLEFDGFTHTQAAYGVDHSGL